MGGAQYQIKLIVNALAETDRFEVSYLTRNFDRRFTPRNHEIVDVTGAWNRVNRGNFLDARKILAELARIKPDVIYQRVASAYTGIGAYYARTSGCRMIWHVAHEWDVAPLRYRLSRGLLLSYIDRKILEYGIRHSTEIVTQTYDQAELLERKYGRQPSKIIYNFHPLPTERIEKTGTIKVVWIANLKPWKQPQVFVNLARDLAHLDGVEFIMIGGLQGGSRWRERLLHDIENQEGLRYLGARTQPEVNQILAGAHIFVNTSKQEGFANTFIQAWMRQVPVVSMNVNPDQSLLKNGIGLVSGSYEGLLANVRELIDNKDLRKRMGKEAQKYAFENHSEKNIDKLIELIDR